MNNRRKSVIALGAGALTAPFASFTQRPGKVWRVGVLVLGGKATAEGAESIGAFVLACASLAMWKARPS